MSKGKSASTLLNLIMAGKAPVPTTTSPLRAYHGSPARFDQFDPNMPGKGGYMHGVGHYFSGDPAIAGGYRPLSGEEGQMVRIKVGNKVVEVPRMDYSPDHNLPKDQYDLDTVRSQLVEDAMVEERRLRGLPTEDFPQFLNERIDIAMNDASAAGDKNHIQRLQQIRDELNLPGGAELEFSPMRGTMSEVDLDVQMDQLMQLQEGQSDQVMDKLTSMDLPKETRDFIDRKGRAATGDGILAFSNEEFLPPMTPVPEGVHRADHFMNTLGSRELVANRRVAEHLQKGGVPGSTYLDDTLMASNNSGESRNYVMFPGSEDLIKKLRTYGVGGAAAGATDAASGNIIESSVDNISKVTDPIDRSTALAEELQDVGQEPAIQYSQPGLDSEAGQQYLANMHTYATETLVDPRYRDDIARRMVEKFPDQGEGVMEWFDSQREDGMNIALAVMAEDVLQADGKDIEADMTSSWERTLGGLQTGGPRFISDVATISQDHFDGDYSLPSFRTEEEANAIAERTGENPDYYMNENAFRNHQYLRGVDLAAAGNKDSFYSAEGASRPQFTRDAPSGIGIGGIHSMQQQQLPIAEEDEPAKRFGYANELYGRSNIPSTLNEDHRSIYDPKGKPRFNRYATDSFNNTIDSVYGNQRNMNPFGRITSGFESAFRPLEISRIAQETGMPVDRIRQINAEQRRSQDRGPTGRMPEGLTQEEYAQTIKEFNAGQKESNEDFNQQFATAISDGTHAVLNKNPLIEFTTGEPFDLGDKEDMRIAATGFQKAVPEAVEGIGTDPSTVAFAGLGGAGGLFAKGASKAIPYGLKGAALGAFGPEDMIIEGGIPAIGGIAKEGPAFFTGDASATDPVTGVKPSDPSYDQKREEIEKKRTAAQGKQYGVLDDLLPEKKKNSVLAPRTKAGGFQVPAFI